MTPCRICRTDMTLATPPRERGFTAGLYGKKRDTYPSDYTHEQVRVWLTGWNEGNDEARLRRAEAKRIADVGYAPETIAVRERNGKIKKYTFEQYRRRGDRLKRHGIGE